MASIIQVHVDSLQTLYNQKFSLDKNLRYLCITEILDRINFCQYGKGHHMIYVIVNTGQKICGIKFRQQDQVAKLAKISAYNSGNYYQEASVRMVPLPSQETS